MEKLKAVLEARGIQLDDESLKGIINRKGYNADSLSDEQVTEVAKELLNGGIVPAASNTPAKGKRDGKLDRSKRTQRTPQPSEDAAPPTGNAAHQTDLEIQAILAQLTVGRDAYAERVAEEGATIIAETPNVVMTKLGEKLLSFQGEPEHFRQTTEAWTASIFPSS